MSVTISDLKYHFYAPTESRNERPVEWHRVSIYNKFYKYGTDTEIDEDDVLTPLRDLRNNTPSDELIVILTGGHGRANGRNYVENSNVIVRDDRLKKRRFFEEDLIHHITNRVLIKDMYKLTFDEMSEFITGEYHVILAFCWSRNDAALRFLLKLEPVISYVNPKSNCTIQ